MRLIVLILAFCFNGVLVASAVGAPPCPAQPGLHKETDLRFLQRARTHTGANAACIERPLRYLSYYNDDPRVVSILISYLDFSTSAPAIAALHSQTPEMDKFPAIYSLAILGESVGPQLIDFLLHKSPDDLEEANALKAYMDAYGMDPVLGIKEILHRGQSENPKVSKRGRDLAGKAAALCRSDVRQGCLLAASQTE